MANVKLGQNKNRRPSLADSGIADDLDLTNDPQPTPKTVPPKPTPRAHQATPDTSATYQDYVTKTARIREAQNEDLTTLARTLNRNKNERSAPRITENTLIRIAIDHLLHHQEILVGDTELELGRALDRHR